MIINLFTRTFLCTPDFSQVDRDKYPSFNFVDSKTIYKDFYEKEFNGIKFHSMPYSYQIQYFYRYMKKNGYLKQYSYNFIVCRGYKEFYKIIFRYMQSIFYTPYITKDTIHSLYTIFTSYTNHYNKWKYIIENEVFHMKDTDNYHVNFRRLFISMLRFEDTICINKDPWCDMIPAEYTLMNESLGRKKFEMFWIYEFIDQIRAFEYKLFNEDKELPEWLKNLHEEYEKSDYSELAYFIKSRKEDIVDMAKKDEESNKFFSTIFISDVWAYAHLDWFTLGYSDLNHFKFNRNLRTTICDLKDYNKLMEVKTRNGNTIFEIYTQQE